MDLATKLDMLWLILCAVLVSTMQAGFCSLESGLVRAKNSINVAIKNLVDFCVSAAMFWLVGYSLMFNPSLHGVVGMPVVPASGMTAQGFAFFFFQLVFCGTAVTIVSGAVAERMRFSGYFAASLVLAGLVYPVTGHWVWGGSEAAPGWLRQMGFHDFAGSTVVHGVGGWMALAAVTIIGPRLGRFAGNGIQGHDLPIAVLGVFLLWFGWFGFNGGSTLALSDTVPLVLVNTALGGAAGGLAALIYTWVLHRLPRVSLIMNGVIAGLVSVTAGCDHMQPGAAVITAIIGGLLASVAAQLMDRTRLDDAVGAVPAHLVAGIWGTLAVALLGEPSGWAVPVSRWQQFQIQLLGVVVIGAYAFGVSLALLALFNRLLPLRVSNEEERIGLNVSEHGACTSTQELLASMVEHSRRGDFSIPVEVEPETEAAPIAQQYNRVLRKVNDVTQDLRHSEQRVRSVLENSVAPLVLVGLDDGRLRYLNVRARSLLQVGAAPIEALSESAFWANAAEHAAVFHRLASYGQVQDAEVRLRAADGRTFPALLSAVRMDYDGSDCAYISFSDITQRKVMEEELRRLATTDGLTGTASRRHFMEHTAQEMARTRRFQHPLAVLLLDADRFKSINDTHGHEAGDIVLRALAAEVRALLRDHDLVGRLGGEEFAVLLPETDLHGAVVVAERIRQALEQAEVPLPDGRMLSVTVSIGVSELHDDDSMPDTLITRADLALYRAKHEGRNRVVAAPMPGTALAAV